MNRPSTQRHLRTPRRVAMLALVVAALSSTLAPAQQTSSFGRYSGYSQPGYDGWTRRAEYAPLPDGVELAVNYFVPTSGGREATTPLPVILIYTRYLRVWEEGTTVRSLVDRLPLLQHLLRYGYVIAIANSRGTGASTGYRNGEWSAREQEDVHHLVEWIAAQSWNDGHVGMWGRSYAGTAAYHAAAQAPPHLDAVFSEMAGPLLYDLVYPGGAYQDEFIRVWSGIVEAMDTGGMAPPARMDSDPSGSRRDAAVAEHADNHWPHPEAAKAKYRDSKRRRRDGETWSWDVASAIHGAAAIRKAAVPVYHLLGWYDIYTTQQALMWTNLEPGPQRMTIGPWTHSGGFGGEVHLAEILRWFDYWLKGIDNGVMDEEPIHYYLMAGDHTLPDDAGERVSLDERGAEDPNRWLAARRWPPRVERRDFYLAKGRSRSVRSINDGKLRARAPKKKKGADRYNVDYSSTVGLYSRWMDGYGDDRPDRPGTTFFDERTAEDEKALTYTSAPLDGDLAIVGHPVVRLWVSSTAEDGDFFVYLEEIDADGRAHYVTEGVLRASFRALGRAPWRDLGLPFHRSRKKDRADLPSEPVELVFDLMGTAIVIDRGHRIRVTVTGADHRNFALHPSSGSGREAPTVSVFRSRNHGSRIELPVVD